MRKIIQTNFGLDSDTYNGYYINEKHDFSRNYINDDLYGNDEGFQYDSSLDGKVCFYSLYIDGVEILEVREHYKRGVYYMDYLL